MDKTLLRKRLAYDHLSSHNNLIFYLSLQGIWMTWIERKCYWNTYFIVSSLLNMYETMRLDLLVNPKEEYSLGVNIC